ncbi:MAG: hypothetical protein WAO00_15405 [Chthoniobacterales bacterium]
MQAQEEAAAGETLLHPLSITITGHLAPPPRSTAEQRAVQYLENQIEQKQAAEAAAAQLPAFWRAPFWKYLPKSTGGTMNSPGIGGGDDDPAVTPTYLMLSARLLEREAAASDKAAKLFFAK